MKKLFFSAVALVAFSSFSMANTIEKGKEKEKEKEKVTVNVDCVAVAIAALDAADPNNTWSSTRANSFYQGQLNACYKSTKQLTAN
jgi:hypothetical protein